MDETQEVTVETGQVIRMTIFLKLTPPTTGSITGIVKDYTTGELISNCVVSLNPGGQSKSTDASGVYSFDDLDAGTYSLTFKKSGYMDETQEVTVTAGQTTQVNVFLKLPPVTTGSITGIVKDYTTGELISNCVVSLNPGGQSKSTDASGVYSFDDLDAGTYSLTFKKSGYMDETQEVTVTAGQTTQVNVFLKLPPVTTGSITGIVKDTDNGQLIANCNITITPGGLSKITSSQGRYEFSDLESGEYTMTFTKSGYETASTYVTVTAGKVSTVDIFLKSKSAFSLSEDSYDFGDLEQSKIFYFFNNSDENCSFSIINIPNWLSFSKTEGTVNALGTESVVATVNRDYLSEGTFSQNVTISYSGKTSGAVILTIIIKKVILSVPSVSISGLADNIKQNSFDILGSITSTGGSQIIRYGHCWNIIGNPTISDNNTDFGSTSNLGSFVSSVANLNASTTYYVRAYAQNAQGVSYSDQIAVTTQDVASDKWDGNIASSFEGGSGTSGDPYLVKTGGQLLLMKNYNSKSFKLVGNIDLNNNNWLPFAFGGSLDGAGYTIKNLRITRTGNEQGLFSVVSGKVKNLNISGVDIQAGAYCNIGAFAGTLKTTGSLSNCNVYLNSNSKILGNENVGGLIGYFGNEYESGKSSLSNCGVYSTASNNVIIGERYVGGVIGYVRNIAYLCTIENCHAEVKIYGTTFAGGICGSGHHYWLDIKNSSFNGTIEGESGIGGIYGGNGSFYNDDLQIVACKSNADFNVSDDYCGGIVGYAGECDVVVISSYSSGKVYCDNSQAAFLSGLANSSSLYLCYSTMTSDHSKFGGLGTNASATDCASLIDAKAYCNTTNCDTSCNDINTFLKESYSDYASYYNFNNIWIWNGTIEGKSKSVKCPRLSWE